MLTAYVVTSGEYSDYGVRSIFSSEDNAKSFIGKQDQPSDYSIEEWAIDGDVCVIRQDLWEFAIYAETGDKSTWRPYMDSGQSISSVELPFRGRAWSWNSLKGLVIIAESSVSYEHAQKVASEARQAWLRTGVAPKRDW